MDPRKWLQWLYLRLFKPFISHRLRWRTGVPLNELQDQLDKKFPQAKSGEADQWLHKKYAIQRYYLRPTDEGLEIVLRWSAYVRLILLILVVLSPILVQSDFSIFLYLGAATIIDGKYTDRPVQACAEIDYENTNGLVGVFLILGLVSVITWSASVVSFGTTVTIASIGFMSIIGIVLLYLMDGLPFVQSGLGKRVLKIPFSFIASAAGSLILFFPLVILSGYINNLGESLSEYAAGETDRATASALSNRVGGFEGDPTPEVILAATTDAFEPLIYFILLVPIIHAVTWVSGCKSDIESFHQFRLGAFKSRRQWWVMFGLLLGLNAVLYAGTVIAFGIVAFGITGTYHLPNWTLQPLLEFLPIGLRVSPLEFLSGMYWTLDYIAADVPVVPTRMVSIGLLLIVLWPFAFVAFGTVTQIVKRPYQVIQLLLNSSPADEDVQEMVGDDIQVRRIDRNSYPDFRPLTVYGLRNYIFVSDIAIDKCEKDKLKGLLLHEEYHIRERSLGGALVFSMFVGGANALAAFHDYRQSECEADQEAANIVGRRTLRHAIYRVYDLRARAKPNPIPGHGPSAVAPEPYIERWEKISTSATNRFRQHLLTIRAYILAPYQLYFGGVLVETAHLSKNERLDMLREPDDK